MASRTSSALDAGRPPAKSDYAMQRLADAVIVPAGPSDAVDLARIHVTSWRESYAGMLPARFLDDMSVTRHARRWSSQLLRLRPGEVVMAAEARDGLVGYCAGAAPEPGGGDRAEIFTLYLLRSAQGRGNGFQLFRSTARVLAAKGAGALELWVLSENRRAQGFYHRLGGRPICERDVGAWSGGLKETLYRWDDIGALSV
jgi:GNAT superfamily N-acetyltransferase